MSRQQSVVAAVIWSVILTCAGAPAGEPSAASVVVLGASPARTTAIVDHAEEVRRDAATFIRFVADSQSGDLPAAFERHYGLEMSAVFDSAWKEVPPIHSLSFNDAKNLSDPDQALPV